MKTKQFLPETFHVFAGPMFSGKSEKLVKSAHKLLARDLNVIGLKPTRDIRNDDIYSRTGLSLPSVKVDSLWEFKDEYDAYIIDEAHLFNDAKSEVEWMNIMRAKGKVLVAGCIDIDYTNHPTEIFSEFIADSTICMTALTARCSVEPCFTEATRTALYINDKRQTTGESKKVDIGDLVYKPLCTGHF